MNETELVERCGKGDNLARKQLYERYAGQLMAGSDKNSWHGRTMTKNALVWQCC